MRILGALLATWTGGIGTAIAATVVDTPATVGFAAGWIVGWLAAFGIVALQSRPTGDAAPVGRRRREALPPSNDEALPPSIFEPSPPDVTWL